MRLRWGMLLAALGATANAQTAPGFTLPGLMTSLAQVRAASATYTETKTLALLNTKLHSTGTLRYVAPGYVRKTTLTPAPQDFTLQDDAVTLMMNGQTRHFSVTQAPQLAGLVEGVRATLAGDLPGLQAFYTVSFSGGADHWQLLLRPRDPQLGKMLAWMSVTGSGQRITEIDSAGAQGDETQMQVQETIDAP